MYLLELVGLQLAWIWVGWDGGFAQQISFELYGRRSMSVCLELVGWVGAQFSWPVLSRRHCDPVAFGWSWLVELGAFSVRPVLS